MKEAAFYEPLVDNSAHCTLCPHGCKIAPGKKGLCGVRANHGGTLVAESYGRITAMTLDPIEKKPLYHFYPGTHILSIGSYGCNFRCGFCQNHDISMQEAPWRVLAAEEVAAASVELAAQCNIGLAYTYNEPLIGYEFVEDCARLVAEQGQKNVLVTNGFVCREPLLRLLPHIHAMNIDLKSFQPAFYKEIGGRLEDVQRTIELAAAHCHVEVTTLVIPGKNDSPEEMKRIAVWLASVSREIPLHISRFFPTYKLQNATPTPPETIYRLVEVAKQSLRYVYPGNC